MPEAGFTSLAYYIDLEWMKEAYRRTRKMVQWEWME